MDKAPPPPSPGPSLPDPALVSRTMAAVAERSQRLVTDFLRRQAGAGSDPDPLNIGGAFLQMTAGLMANSGRLVQAQIGLWQDYLTLWQNTARRMIGERVEPVITEATHDRRFRDDAWRDNEVFDFIRQSYLLSARFVQGMTHGIDGLDDRTARKVDFYTRQFVEAMSPSNFLMTNPEVLRRTAETGGENLVKGLAHLLADLEQGKGRLRPRLPGESGLRLGETIAATPGAVVFENPLMQVLQYAPATAEVLRRPLLVVPPWINKYYVLDLRPKNSLLRWAVEHGHTVFAISWVNPDAALAEASFEDYLRHGVLAALEVALGVTGAPAANAVGYGLGGTLLACAMAQLAARQDERIASATYLAAMLDFAEAGNLGVFIDEEDLRGLEARARDEGGGQGLAATSSLLRANDLIWSFVVSSYLLGQEPFPFDLLHWNGDTTRLPAAMHGFYLRHLYQENALARPGGLVLDGVPLDLGAVRAPSYAVGARDDHITPWRSVYRATQLLGGPVRFVLAGSGHVAGIANPPAAGRHHHWIDGTPPADPEAWLANATALAGSWWPDWQRWVAGLDPARVPARQPGGGGHEPIEPAPGRYVQVTETD